jgi:hypothetical protein
MDPRIPEPIRPAVQHYLTLVNQQLPELLKSFYIEGSIALDGFNEDFSDIDFIASLNRPATHAEIETLRSIHQAIEKRYPQRKMAGSYVQARALERGDHHISLNPHYHDGVLRLHGHFELNSVEGWILKNHGIAVVGPTPQDLPFSIDWEALIKTMRHNLNSYWGKWTKRPDHIMVLLADWGIQWAVLGVLRQFYSFRENAITTKVKAGEYALTCLPERWHPLIREALHIRAGTKGSAYAFRIARTVEAIQFLKFIIRTCNASFN